MQGFRMNLASDKQERRHEIKILGSVITSEFTDLAASPGVARSMRTFG